MDRRMISVCQLLALFLWFGSLSVKVKAQTQYSSVQLISTPTSYTRQGNVYVAISGAAYGAICDTNWTITDAIVICRQLGYDVTAGSASASNQVNSAYGTTSGTAVMTQVSCIGNEVDIAHCPYVSPVANPTSQCTSAHFAGVTCFGQYLGTAVSSTSLITCQNTASVRLANGTSSNFTNGILQVSQNSGTTWGTVCSQGFTQTNAKVVCSSLCSGVSTNAMAYPGSYYGQGTPLQIVLTNVSCVGTESSLLQCPSNAFNSSTTCSDAVGINCAGSYSYIPTGTLTCGGSNMQLLLNQTTNYVVTSITPVNPSLCVNSTSYTFSSTSSAYLFTLSYNDCNTSYNVLYNSAGLPAYYSYSNLVTIYVQDSLGSITRANQFQMNISCSIQRTSTANNTFQTGTVILPSQQNNASITVTAVINFFADPGYSVVLQPPVQVQLNTPIYAQVVVSQAASALNYRVLVPTCVASPFLNMSAPLYYLIQNNCMNDSTTVIFASTSSTTMQFVFYSFQFTGNYSAVYLQCTTLLCAQNDYSGLCSGVCGVSGATGRRKRDTLSVSFETNLLNGPVLSSQQAPNYFPG